MTIGPTTKASDKVQAIDLERIVRPAQIASAWSTVIDAAGMDDADNAGSDITAPATQVTLSTRKIWDLSDQYKGLVGTTLRVRMGYDVNAALTTSPVIEVFGRFDSNDAWKRLLNKNATPAYNVTLTVATTTDVSDGTYKYTECSPADHAFDLDGCQELLFAVKTAFAVSAGSAATAFMQAKVI